VSAPVLGEQVHLRAKIANASERTLLKGDASIFHGSDYVGTTALKQTAQGEAFEVFLGIDDQIKVKRELIERQVEKSGLLQESRRTTSGYRITVHNYAASRRQVVLRDRLPVSQHEQIKVKELRTQPQPDEQTKLKLLTWNLTLPPDGEQKVEYRFTVEHPHHMLVPGLPTE
jgi:uncharacterized protein (TIGR02231 family)